MKTEWLETVLAVAKVGSFSEAAELIPCAQSSISRHIKSAEQELGVILFQRSSNSNIVRLTADGVALIPAVERTFGAYSDLCQKAKLLSSRQIPLVLGLDAHTFSASSKARLLSLFYIDASEVVLAMAEFPPTDKIDVLTSGKADAFLFARAYPTGKASHLTLDSDLLRCVPIGQEQLSIAFGEDYAPKQDSISLAQLADRNIFFHTDIFKDYDPDNIGTRHNLFVQACLNCGVQPKIQTVDRHLADIKLILTAQGKGVFPCTIPAFLREYPKIRYLPVSDAPYYVQYYLLSMRQNKNPALDKLTIFLENRFQSPLPQKTDLIDIQHRS